MKRSALVLLLAILGSGFAAAPAAAEFGIAPDPEVTFLDPEGDPSMQAGSHPFAMRTYFEFNAVEEDGGVFLDGGAVKDLSVLLPEGFVGDSRPVPPCATVDFLTRKENGFPVGCADSSAVGYLTVRLGDSEGHLEDYAPTPVYLLEPPPGVAARLGFKVADTPVTVEVGVSPASPYNLLATQRNIPQVLDVHTAELVLWGNPADPRHDPDRGQCVQSAESCEADIPQRPFLTLPRSCAGPLLTDFAVAPWAEPGAWAPARATTPPGPLECARLGLSAEIVSLPTNEAADSPSGLQFELRTDDEGLTNPCEAAIANSDIKRIEVTFPEGVTLNPSQAEGLGTCSEAELARESAGSAFGAGCPAASKVGTIEVDNPLLGGEILRGSVFVATPFANLAGDSLIAIYVVIRSPERGIVVRQAGRVTPDPVTGQLVSTFEQMPQLPLGDVTLRLREGARSPLVTPRRCGTYVTRAELTPWANPGSTYTATSSFQITGGPAGGPCPPAGPPPFEPGFAAGTLNNAAGSFSPLHMRLTRRDGDQDLVRFSAQLPEGILPKLAGISWCADAQIAAAQARSGRAELAAPSCPAASRIGSALAGAGVGSQLTYVPGSLYLAGPYKGAPLSVAAIVPAVAGPFDVGTVVTRVGLRLDPATYRGEIDGASSDPIPHILAGIPLRVRDIQVAADRPEFILNPTSCRTMAIGASISGGGLDPFGAADDFSVPRSERFQAANCAELGFAPRLAIRLRGGTKRGGHPALRAVLRPRPGDANLSRAVVKLPRSAFLDQAHIRTVCTRVQFAQESCPPGSVYGHVRAFTPLLDQPLEGPAILRSSSNPLPDLVFDLEGIVEIETAARIDSRGGGIRATFPAIPDAPITKVIVNMAGGKKGLIVNSTDLCRAKHRARLTLGAHNGRLLKSRPLVRARCGKGKARRGR